MPVNPTIQPAVPVSVGADGGHDTGFDFDTLPSDLRQEIARHLGVEDLNNLSLASARWSDAPSAKLFDRACKAAILQAESGALRDLPAVDATRFAGKAAGLANAGYPHAALLLNLQQVRAGLASASTIAATGTSRNIPDLKFFGARDAVWTSSGEPEFVGVIQDPASGETRIGFCPRREDIRMPELLRNMSLVSSQGGFSVCNSLMSRSDAKLIVQSSVDGRLAVYHPEADKLEHLPDAFTHVAGNPMAIANMSPNGRYITADIGGRLLVYDRIGEQLVTNAEGGTRHGLSVDSYGIVLVGKRPTVDPALKGWELRPGAEWVALEETQGQHGGGLNLCPNDRYLVKQFRNTANLVLVDRQGEASGIELLHDTSAPHGSQPKVQAIALSQANAIAAVAYSNGTLHLFDLAEAVSGHTLYHAFVEAKHSFFTDYDIARPALLFSRDGTRLDVVYQKDTLDLGRSNVEFLSFALLDGE